MHRQLHYLIGNSQWGQTLCEFLMPLRFHKIFTFLVTYKFETEYFAKNSGHFVAIKFDFTRLFYFSFYIQIYKNTFQKQKIRYYYYLLLRPHNNAKLLQDTLLNNN